MNPNKHAWEKMVFQKIHSKGRTGDRLRCKICGAKAKQFGDDIEIDTRSLRDPAVKACGASC